MKGRFSAWGTAYYSWLYKLISSLALAKPQRESNKLSGSIVIPSRKVFSSQMVVRHVRDFPCSIEVTSGFLNAEIKVRGYRDVKFPARITVRVKTANHFVNIHS